MMRARWTGKLTLSLLACFVTQARVTAQESYSTGAETWAIDSSGTLSSNDWPIQGALQLSLSAAVDEGKPKEAGGTAEKAAAPLPELQYGSDREVTMLGVIEGKSGTKVTNMEKRSVRFDADRRAIRILDVISSNDSNDQKITISYTTRWRPEIVPKLAKPRPFTVGAATASSGALVAVTGDSKLPVLMFIFGAQAKGWTRTVSATPDTLRWEYTGTLAARQRVVLLHWLALTDDAKTATLKTIRESLIQDGMPVDASLNAQVQKELANFPMEIEAGTAKSELAASGLELPFVKALCANLKIERTPDQDHVVLSGGPILKGDFSAGEMRLKTHAENRTLLLEDIAAIQGGAGMGRRARVYLRDGTVAGGVLTWKEAAFKDASLGTMKLSPESLDTLILRSSSRDHEPAGFAALWVGQDGDVHGLPSLPSGMAPLRWAGGELQVPWSQITTLRQRPLPEIGQEIALKDGSRLHAWFSPSAGGSPLSSCSAYATTWNDLMAVLGGGEAPLQVVDSARLQTTDASSLTGAWGQAHLTLATDTGAIELPVSEIQRVTVTARLDDGSSLLEVATSRGATLRGGATTDGLAWKRGDQVLTVPWPLISEITTPKALPAKP